MNRITLGQGIIVAAIFALLSAAAFAALTLLMAPILLLKAMIVVLNAAYLGVLMKRSGLRRGRLALPLAWLVAAIAIGLWAPSLAAYVILHTGLLWLSRTLCCHANVLSTLIDLVLCSVALVAAIGAAVHSGSVLLSVWSFFLIQAASTFIPTSFGPVTAPTNDDPAADFERAYRQATAALRRLNKPI